MTFAQLYFSLKLLQTVLRYVVRPFSCAFLYYGDRFECILWAHLTTVYTSFSLWQLACHSSISRCNSTTLEDMQDSRFSLFLGPTGCLSLVRTVHLHLRQPLEHGPPLQGGWSATRGPQVYNKQVSNSPASFKHHLYCSFLGRHIFLLSVIKEMVPLGVSLMDYDCNCIVPKTL